MHWISFRVIIKRIAAIKSFMRDKTVPLRKKLLIAFGIFYLVLPVDLIPPILFPFGFIDDLILWVFILLHLKDELDKYWVGEKQEDLSKKFRDKNIVEGVEFDVEDGQKDNKKGDEE